MGLFLYGRPVRMANRAVRLRLQEHVYEYARGQ